jgi:hypothetical protein
MRHYEDSILVKATPEEVFNFADDHKNFASHMNKSSLMMGGGSMETEIDSLGGKEKGSHIKMYGSAFGISIYLDEVVVIHEPPHHKEWQTVGELKILVIGHYKLGFHIQPAPEGSKFTVYIDYDQPKTLGSKILYILFSKMYANWCVKQMIDGVRNHFN